MMEQEVLPINDVDIEEGELTGGSSDEVYTPLQRPSSSNKSNKIDSPLATCYQMQSALAETVVNNNDGSSASSSSTSSDEESDNGLKKPLTESEDTKGKRKHKKTVKRTVMVRVQPTNPNEQEKKSRFKKYNIWTAALQEEALTENMRGCDVTRNNCNDRNVENYDFSLKYRLNGENSLKRRLSNSTDEESEYPATKKRRSSNDARHAKRSKDRLSSRRNRRGGIHGSTPNTSGSDNSCEPRFIRDLDVVTESDPYIIAQEMAKNLFENKDELFVRIVEVLGLDIPIEIYKETQRIEADGGMLVMNGNRRRTPGGVFLFLLKKDEKITAEQSKAIFLAEKNNRNKLCKEQESLIRNRKVEELKKRLSEQESELTSLSSRKELLLLGDDLNSEIQTGNLSNPPPSPVGHEYSPEYKAHAINHVVNDNAIEQQPSTSKSALSKSKDNNVLLDNSQGLVVIDDDCLDVFCGDMDFF